MLSVIYAVIYAQCHIKAPYTECRYAECRVANHSRVGIWHYLQLIE